MGEQLRVAPYLGVYYYGFNLSKPPFKDNPELRQALSMAIDREMLVGKASRAAAKRRRSAGCRAGVDNYDPPQLSYAALTQARAQSDCATPVQGGGLW